MYQSIQFVIPEILCEGGAIGMDKRGLTYHFAHWAKSLKSSDIPNNVQTTAHRAMLDTLAVTLAGAAHSDIENLAETWPAYGGGCKLATGGVGSAETAALINGAAAHFWDFDDTSYTGIMHGSAVVFPTVVALAQELGSTEEEARIAFIIGSEIAYTLADICTHQHYFNGWWSTTTFSLVGATAAAARLFGCSIDQTAQAIGLAAAGAGGGKSVFGTQAKPFLVGETAQRAITFARFIASGLTGPASAFDGKTGFLHLLNNDVAHLNEADTLGQRWRLTDPGLLVKRYPVCSAAHAAIDEIVRLTFKAGLTSNDIDVIQMEIPKLVRISLIHDTPKTPSEAQFSLPFVAACAIRFGAVRLSDLNLDFLHSPEQQSLMQKVKTNVAEDLSTDEMRKRFPESARAEIILNDGSIRSGFCGEAYGMPAHPLSDADFLEKFRNCLYFAGCSEFTENILAQDVLCLAASLYDREAEHPTMHAISRGGTCI
jgi:2-methylcitrate dehydratase PrpD